MRRTAPATWFVDISEALSGEGNSVVVETRPPPVEPMGPTRAVCQNSGRVSGSACSGSTLHRYSRLLAQRKQSDQNDRLSGDPALWLHE